MKPFGSITRGTTNPNRLRRIDIWMAWRYQSLLSSSAQPLVVDLGYGATPVTTHELASRLQRIAPATEVLGLEIDPERVALAKQTETTSVRFALGGFEVPASRPAHVIRALNVLRQYQEQDVAAAWQSMQQRLSADGRIVEGTCDEIGRKAVWVELDSTKPISLTFAAHLPSLEKPSDLAPRLPKILIHKNVAGQKIHALLADMDKAWAKSSALAVFSSRQRWAEMLRQLRENWSVITPPSREKHGELTIAWSAITSEGAEHPRPQA